MRRAVRSTLRALRREFLRAADRHPELFHEFLFHDEDTVTIHTDGSEFDGWTDEDYEIRPWCVADSWSDVWKPFIEVNADREKKPSWETWDTLEWVECGRFYGRNDGLDEFKQLAESLAIVLGEINVEVPFRSYRTGKTYQDFSNYKHALDDIYALAGWYPTPLLRLKQRMWDLEDGAFDDKLWRMWSKPNRGDLVYPLHPYCERLVHGVFTSAAAAIELLLDPRNALILDPTSLPSPLLSALGEEDPEPILADEQAAQTTVGSAATLPTREPSTEESPHVFLREGDIWTLRFTAGSSVESGKFKDRRGFAEYAKLLANPGERIDSLELVTSSTIPMVPRHSQRKSAIDAPLRVGMTHQEMADEEYIAELLEKKKSLEDQSATAESMHDKGTEDALNYQIKDLQKQLDRLTHAGRRKEFDSGQNDKLAHQSLKLGFYRLRTYLATKGMPRLSLYLDQTVEAEPIYAWRYKPVEPIEWVLGAD